MFIQGPSLCVGAYKRSRRRARNANLRRKLEWFLVINFHVIVSAAVIAVVIGIVHVENNHQKPSDSHIIKFGLAIVFICWITLFSWALLSLRAQRHTDPLFYANGSAVRLFTSPSSLLSSARASTNRKSSFSKELSQRCPSSAAASSTESSHSRSPTPHSRTPLLGKSH